MTALIELLIYLREMNDTECVQIILLGADLLTVYSPGFTPHFKVKTV